MKKLLIPLLAIPLLAAQPAFAACAVSGPTTWVNGTGTDYNGLCTAIQTGDMAMTLSGVQANATSLTKIQQQSLLKQLDQYAKQVEETQQMVIQTEMLTKDLEEQPLQVIVPDINQLRENQQRIDQLARDISNNSATIGTNLLKDLKNPDTIGLGYGSKFQLWSEARTKAVGESLKSVTDFVKQEPVRNEQIKIALQNADAAQGKTATLKAIAQISVQQLQWLQKLEEDISHMIAAQSIENGATLDQQMTAARANQDLKTDSISDQIQLPKDSYQGPGGYSGTSAF